MKKDNHTNNFLGKWLSGNLSKEELKFFEESEDYLAYKDILKGVDRLEKPFFDVDKKLKEQKNYNTNYKNNQKTKVKPLVWLYSAVAVALVLIGIRILFFKEVITIHTKIAEKSSITLPDNSKVTLNAVSSLEYNKKHFMKHRVLQLDGAAFFDVEKGSSFTVNTRNGEITVLGTEFDVYSRGKTLEVYCFEGKVSVLKEANEIILTAGKGTKFNPENRAFTSFEISNKKPNWLQGKSSFSEVPLKKLIEELERQYDIEIQTRNIDTNRVFTGFFIHNNLKTALKTSFEPMNIHYTIKGKVIVLKNK